MIKSIIKVIPALAIFLAIVSIPFWMNLGAEEMEKPELPSGMSECIESREYMRINHMKMLDEWRDESVRKSEHFYTNSKGQKFEKSLVKTCMNCHSSQEKFCERCHSSVGVKNYCWDCHFTPEQMEAK